MLSEVCKKKNEKFFLLKKKYKEIQVNALTDDNNDNCQEYIGIKLGNFFIYFKNKIYKVICLK